MSRWRERRLDDYYKLKDLMILKNYLHNIYQDIVDYLTEKGVVTFAGIPIMAENYCILLCKC